jgi:hypothetical protein
MLRSSDRSASFATESPYQRTLSQAAETTEPCHKPGPRAAQQIKLLFDQLVRPENDRRRYCKPKRPGGPQVDNEFELGRPLHRQVTGLRPL